MRHICSRCAADTALLVSGTMAHRKVRTSDLSELVHAAYDVELSPAKWLQRIAAAFDRIIDGDGAYAFRYQVSGTNLLLNGSLEHGNASGAGGSFLQRLGKPFCDMAVRYSLDRVHPELVDRAYLSPCGPRLLRERGREIVVSLGHPEWYPEPPKAGKWLSVPDSWGVNIPDERGGGLSIACPESESKKHPNSHARAIVEVLPALQAAQRLRHHLPSARSSIEAVITPDGSVTHASGAARESDSLSLIRDAVTRLERGRGARERDIWRGESIWPGIIAGRWSLVERIESDGKRYLVAHANSQGGLNPLRLSQREAAVAERVAQGMMDKEVAADLRIAQSAVAASLHDALGKLRLGSRLELILNYQRAPSSLAYRIGGLGPSEPLVALELREDVTLPAGFSDAEREVTRLLVRGMSNQEIAAERGCHNRTVANQIRGIFSKAGVSSRSELASLLWQEESPLSGVG